MKINIRKILFIIIILSIVIFIEALISMNSLIIMMIFGFIDSFILMFLIEE
jgi:hypothetical protein